jgi:hypothetical protein
LSLYISIKGDKKQKAPAGLKIIRGFEAAIIFFKMAASKQKPRNCGALSRYH